jgi:hypothetical protein
MQPNGPFFAAQFTPDDPLEYEGEDPGGLGRGPGATRRLVLALIMLTAAISVAGIVIGRDWAPSSPETTTTLVTPAVPATTPTRTSAAPATKPTTAPATVATPTTTNAHVAPAAHARKPQPAASRLGPFAISGVAHFASGAPGGGAALVGGLLLVTAGPGDASLYAGRLTGPLRRLARLGSGERFAMLLATGGSLERIGGEQGALVSDSIERVALPSGQASAAGSFEEPLAEAAVAGPYLVGGWTGSKDATAILRVGASGAAALVARLPVGLREPAAVLVGSRLYVAGGRGASGLSRAVYLIDTADGSVEQLGELPAGVADATLLAAGGELYLLGGLDQAGRATAQVERIDPSGGAVSSAGKLPRPLTGAVALAGDGRIVLVVPSAGEAYRLGPPARPSTHAG